MRHPEGPDSSHTVSNLFRAMAVLTGVVGAAGGVGCATAPMTPADREALRAAEEGEVVYKCRESGKRVTQLLLEAEGALSYDGCNHAESIVDKAQGVIDGDAHDACGPREIEFMQDDVNSFERDRMQPGCTGDMPADKEAREVRSARTCKDVLTLASAREGAAFLFAKDGECDYAIEQYRAAVRALNIEGRAACKSSALDTHREILQGTYRRHIAPRCDKK